MEFTDSIPYVPPTTTINYLRKTTWWLADTSTQWIPPNRNYLRLSIAGRLEILGILEDQLGLLKTKIFSREWSASVFCLFKLNSESLIVEFGLKKVKN